MDEKTIKVFIDKGMVHVEDIPTGVLVQVIDYDVEGEPWENLDEYEGRACLISLW